MNTPRDSADPVMNPTPSPDSHHSSDDRVAVADQRRCSNERFELLSAYMDGEVTAEERRLVESWLANEPQVRQMHQRLLALKDGFSAMPTAESSQPIEQTIDQVFEKVERRSRLRVIVGGTIAAAAALVATVVGINTVGSGSLQFASQTANRTQERVAPAPAEANTTAGLLVSLDEPVLVISKTASGGKSVGKTATWEDNAQ
jgi:anti-sigma factor RsiW